MQTYKNISALMERIIHKYNQAEKNKIDYGTNQLLTRVEIHTIQAIGEHSDINVTALAEIRGITKGAASQMVYKLVDKGLVEKKGSPLSDTEVCLTLSDRGKIAFNQHKKYHEKLDKTLYKDFFKDMNDDFFTQMITALELFDKSLDDELKKK